MSKTFKALQRAAKERAARGDAAAVPKPKPLPIKSNPPSAATARLIAVQRAHERDRGSAAAEPVPAPVPLREVPPHQPEANHGLHGEMNSGLRQLLEETFGRAVPGLVIGDDGWVQGRLDPAMRSELLQRYDLLHCLVRDADHSFWFWGSARESRELAERSGYGLDPD